MKIKVINPDVNEAITIVMEKSAQKTANSNTDIVCVNPRSGPRSIDDAFTKEIASYYILEEIIRSEKEDNIDGYVIACFADPAVHAAREITNKPIIGIGEASIMLTQLISEQFSIITVGPSTRWIYKEIIHKTGASNKVASLRSPLMSSEEAHTNPEYIKELAVKEAKLAIEKDFAEAIILGCGVMTELANPVQEILKVPVINPVAAGVKMAEALIGLNQTSSKAYSYKTPHNPKLIQISGLLNI